MGSATVKLILRTDKTRADGTAPVYLRATQARRTRQAATGIWLEPKVWNADRGQVRRSHPLSKAYNARLEDLLTKARRAAIDSSTAADVLAALSGGAGSFTAFLKGEAAALREERKEYAARALEATGAKLHAALGYGWPDGILPWNALTPASIDRFGRYCRGSKKNKSNTVRRDYYRLQTLCNLAVRRGILKADGNPFLRVSMPKKEKVRRRRLTLAEIDALRRLELGWATPDRAVRDGFLFSIYAHGIRISDLCRLTPANLYGYAEETVDFGDSGDFGDGAPAEVRLIYTMQKTEGKAEPLSPKLPPAAVEIVRPYVRAWKPGRYLFPLMHRGDDADPFDLRKRQGNATVYYNRHLRRIGEAAGIGGVGLTSHVARHTFADLARKSGDLFAVSKALGHTSLGVTQQYLASFDRAAVDALSDSLWGE